MPDSIGLRGSGFQTVRVNFCLLDSWEYVENQPVCHIYQWVAHPTHGGVCNHCERMMDGLRLDDIIAGNREGSLTEDEIVEFVQSGDPNQRDWDDWPLRMTFRINSFLRGQGDVGEPDLAALGFLEDKFNVKHFFRHALPLASSLAMDSECALPIFSHPDSSTFYLFVGFHYTLKQYGEWIRPIQLRCHYRTVKCIIQLHETFQM